MIGGTNCFSWISVANLVVDSVNGNDLSGSRNGAPVRTLTRAKALAVSGDTILVCPGTYAENDLLKNGVNWHFLPGAIVAYVELDTGNAYGIFDDRSSGACTCIISGAGDFFITFSPNNTNSRGLLYLQNASSNVQIEAARFRATGSTDGTQLGKVGAVRVENCTRFIGNIGEIFDPNVVIGVFAGSATGVYWEIGEFYLTTRRILFNQYGYWGGGAGAADAYLTVEYMASNSGSAVYHAPSHINNRVWITAKEIRNAGLAAVYASAGKCYVVADKITADTGAFYGVNASGTGLLWVTCQKCTAPKWINTAGTAFELYVSCQQYEDNGGTTGFTFNGTGTVYCQGGRAKILAGKGVDHVAATCIVRLQNMIIDSSNTDSVNNPAVNEQAAGGLTLDGCTLVSGPSSSSVKGSAAGKIIKNWGSVATRAIDAANVTVQVQAIAVDANVA